MAHIYSRQEPGDNDAPSAGDRLAGSWNSGIDDVNASNDEAIRNLSEIEQRVSEIPVIGDILTYDFHNDAIIMAIQSAAEKLTERINDLMDGV